MLSKYYVDPERQGLCLDVWGCLHITTSNLGLMYWTFHLQIDW